ncbi:unnamed protein product [Paramecium primaurelia]|uniref:Uncharacterized protein n=1 Tax=Paramecium primaurelia TaxID=5886 RepID=A0A8S1PKT3_PARPR|nr:unnamed protein product [Paramecium primaurelia]
MEQNWRIMQKDFIKYVINVSAGGFYDERGEIKLGQWTDLFEGFQSSSQITCNGQYENGENIERWTFYTRINPSIHLGIKIGYWIEEDKNCDWDSQIIYCGNYHRGKKIGRQDIQNNKKVATWKEEKKRKEFQRIDKNSLEWQQVGTKRLQEMPILQPLQVCENMQKQSSVFLRYDFLFPSQFQQVLLSAFSILYLSSEDI